MSRTAEHMRGHHDERGFGVLLLVAIPVFLVLVVFSRLFNTRSAVQVGEKRPSLLREATEWARSTIAVSFQN
jgi:hypothetical protein